MGHRRDGIATSPSLERIRRIVGSRGQRKEKANLDPVVSGQEPELCQGAFGMKEGSLSLRLELHGWVSVPPETMTLTLTRPASPSVRPCAFTAFPFLFFFFFSSSSSFLQNWEFNSVLSYFYLHTFLCPWPQKDSMAIGREGTPRRKEDITQVVQK